MALIWSLPDFQKFLLERKLTLQNRTSFFAYWVTRYMSFAQRRNIALEDYEKDSVIAFLEELRADPRIKDWQPRQAEDALRLYYFHYLGKSGPQSNAPKITNVEEALTELTCLIRLKHYSFSTERSYIQWSNRFLAYVMKTDKKDIADLSPDDFKNFLTHLAVKKQVSASTQNQAFNAILFLFRNVLCREVKDLNTTVRAKRGPKLPVVLSVDEVRRIFDQMTGLNRLMAEMLYGTGMRLMEIARLRVLDVDFEMDTIFVRGGKGDKDRTTMLPTQTKDRLKKHLVNVNALHEKDLSAGYGAVYLLDALSQKYPNAPKEWKWQYVFPSSTLSVDPHSGIIRRYHISDTAIQKAVKLAVQKAGIAKHASVHTLRHSFATHLLQSGVNIREVQSLLGHKHVETTMIYTHVLRDMKNAPKSPLDALYLAISDKL